MHFASPRKKGPFVCLNCAALTETLLESELFGHERGAFTGATERKIGKFEAAHQGTVMLDEIGEMSPSIQAKFLRVLEGHSFERVGGSQQIKVDVRVIAATNRDLSAAVKSGAFRDDLYHRLNVVAITPPALRERREDIPILADFFLRKFASATRRNVTTISDGAQARMLAYDWPGNVRELANAIERAVVLGTETEISATDLPFGLESDSTTTTSETVSYHDGVNATRKEMVIKALRKTGGNRAAAARLLDLEAKYFLRLMKSLGIE
jgi:Nif-specific regulatory protein